MKKFKSLAYWLVACKYLPGSIKVTLKSRRAVGRWHSQLKWYLIQSVFSIRNLNSNYFCTSKENYGANPRSLALQLLHLLICLDAFSHQTARWLMKYRTLYARNLWQTRNIFWQILKMQSTTVSAVVCALARLFASDAFRQNITFRSVRACVVQVQPGLKTEKDFIHHWIAKELALWQHALIIHCTVYLAIHRYRRNPHIRVLVITNLENCEFSPSEIIS